MPEAIDTQTIHSQLLKVNEIDDSKDFVAISCEINDTGECQHSGLVICFLGEIKYFHFGGKEVFLDNITANLEKLDSLYVKHLDVVKEEEVATFLGHCEKLKKEGVIPQYGFVFNNSYYDSQSKESYLVNATHDITTCVGFCIKVIRGFLDNNPEYMKISDWDESTLDGAPDALLLYMKHYLKKYAEAEGIDYMDLFSQDELKRILPSELITSGFFKDLPITKINISSICPIVQGYFKQIKVA